MFKEFRIWAIWGQNVGPIWVKNGKKGYFHDSHLTPSRVFPKSKEIFSMSLLKSVLPVLTNQAEWFISHGIGCSYISGNLLLSFFLLHSFKVLVKSRGGVTFLCLTSSVNFQQNFFWLKDNCSVFYFQDLDEGILNLIYLKIRRKGQNLRCFETFSFFNPLGNFEINV